MINRINLLLRAKNITAKQFAEEIGIQPSGMSHILGGRNNPSLDFVSKVLRRYPEIDANWLVMGKGEMYVSSRPVSDAPAPVEPPAAITPSLFDEEPVAKTAPLLTQEPVVNEDTPSVMKVEEPGVRYAPTYIAAAPEPAGEGDRKVVRMLLIYSDNTFSEYRPR